jgi:hypothetical protein
LCFQKHKQGGQSQQDFYIFSRLLWFSVRLLCRSAMVGPASPSIPSSTRTTIEISPRSVAADTDMDAKQRWFREELGLCFDPFALLDAGADPHLPQYLVGQGAMEQLWGDWPSFLFAPPGGGKTAFRVWLTRACRTRRDGRRILPVVLTLTQPEETQASLPWERYIEATSHAIAASLLLDLAYQTSSSLTPSLFLIPSCDLLASLT